MNKPRASRVAAALLRASCLGMVFFGLWWDFEYKALLESNAPPHVLTSGVFSRGSSAAVIVLFGLSAAYLLFSIGMRLGRKSERNPE